MTLGFFGGAVVPLTIGIVVELFDSRVQGRLASMIDATCFAAVIVLGVGAGKVDFGGWRVLLWIGGIPPLIFALAACWLIPALPVHHDEGRGAAPGPSAVADHVPPRSRKAQWRRSGRPSPRRRPAATV